MDAQKIDVALSRTSFFLTNSKKKYFCIFGEFLKYLIYEQNLRKKSKFRIIEFLFTIFLYILLLVKQ